MVISQAMSARKYILDFKNIIKQENNLYYLNKIQKQKVPFKMNTQPK